MCSLGILEHNANFCFNHVPVFVANIDVGHEGTYYQPHDGEFAKVATAWYKWQLKGDDDAGKLFTGNPCLLSKSTVWKVDKKNLPYIFIEETLLNIDNKEILFFVFGWLLFAWHEYSQLSLLALR